jgi:hypothetical protein
VNGGGSWQGRIRTAEVRTSAGSVDYVAPGALTVPASYVLLPDHVTPFPPPTPTEWLVLLIHFVSFMPLGYLLVTSRWSEATFVLQPSPPALWPSPSRPESSCSPGTLRWLTSSSR